MPELAVGPSPDLDLDLGLGPSPDANRVCWLIRERSGMPLAMGVGHAGWLRAG